MEKDKPRYSRISDIIDLATFMYSKPLGVTINEIAERYCVSRRTAERMRDSLTSIFVQVDEIETTDSQKHWGFINYSISHLVSFTDKEIADIEQLERKTSNLELKREYSNIAAKMKSMTNNKNLARIEENVQLYLQTEGYAVSQKPKYNLDLNAIDIIREAIQGSIVLKAVYHEKQRILEPLGFIYGEKLYLIAREKAKGDGIYTFLMHKLSNPELTRETFDKGDFNLQEHANRSFGVYQSEILDVKLSFDETLANEASEYNFHPTQKTKKEKDGSLTVTFKASGSREIFWHVFKWGKGCKIIAPKSLKDEYKTYLKENLANY